MSLHDALICIAEVSFTVLVYVYFGYYLILRLFSSRFEPPPAQPPQRPLHLTVLITVFNEERAIRERLHNVLACDYPSDRLEILVASDGSTDRTDEFVSCYPSPHVRLFRPTIQLGKSATQNAALEVANGEIIVFTDAATCFDRSFLKEIAQPFNDSAVGGVDGHLQFIHADATDALAESQGYYWTQELMIRERESQLGILAVASGACLAVRKSLLASIPSNVGEDCVVPLQVVRQRHFMRHQSTAKAYDRLESSAHGEFRARARMTLRNLQGTLLYPELLNPFRRPGVAWGLWSHKLLRWLSPLFLASWIIASLALIPQRTVASVIATPALLFVLGCAILFVYPRSRTFGGLRILWSFMVANAGFAAGVFQALSGKRIVAYRK